MKFFEKRDRRGVACNPEQATGLLTGGAGTLFDISKLLYKQKVISPIQNEWRRRLSNLMWNRTLTYRTID